MLSNIVRDTRGNFSLMLAVGLTAIVTGVGVAVDYSDLTRQKIKLAGITDAAAVAGATQARNGSAVRRKAALSVFDENTAMQSSLNPIGQPKIEFDDGFGEVTVAARVDYSPKFMGMFGYNTIQISASSTVSYAIEYMPPISIAFALDTSGSMGETTPEGDFKIDALQEATGELFDALFESAENPTLLAQQLTTGFSTYNTDIIITEPIQAGYDHIARTMDMNPLFYAEGGTDSTSSVQYALDQLLSRKAIETDPKWRGYIVFMTDGDNNETSADDLTKDVCATAKDAGISIYTIAFAAPPRGEELLEECASDPSNAFDSQNSQKLKKAFETIGLEIGESVVRIKN